MNLKKSISLVLTLCMVFSLFATFVFPVAAEEGSATISFANTANRTAFSTSEQVWEQNGITVTNTKTATSSDVADYVAPVRFYKNSIVKIDYAGMTKIEIDCAGIADKNVNAWVNSCNDANATATREDSVVTIVFAEAVDSFTITLTDNQARAKAMTVYYAIEEEAPVISKVVTCWNADSWQNGYAGEGLGAEYGAYIYTDAGIYANVDMGYWIHVAFAPVADNEGVYEVAAIRGPSESAPYLTIPENGFVWTAWTSAGDSAESAGAFALSFMSNLKVGNWVKFTGLDIAEQTTTEDATAEVVIDPNAPVNVALNKNYAVSGLENSTYNAKLTDGNAYGAMTYDNKWFAFLNANMSDNVGYVIVNLGGLYDISKVQANLVNDTGAGVVAPEYVKVFVSVNAVDWEEAGALPTSTAEQTAYWAALSDLSVTAQYVKIEIKKAGTFAFINEVEVYGKESAETVDKGAHNAAFLKDYTISGCGEPYDKYAANLTDALACQEYKLDANWFAFYNNGTHPGDNAPDKVGTIVIDLGEVFDIASVKVNALDAQGASGIKAPAGFKAYLSEDGENWGEAITLSYTLPAEQGAFVAESAVSGKAKFVKVEVSLDGVFAFINEIEVWTAEEDVPVEEEPVAGTDLPENLSQCGSPYGDLSVLLDGYTGVGEVNTYDGFQDKLFGIANANFDETAYSFTLVFDEEKTFNTVSIYALDYYGGCVHNPADLTVVINGVEYDVVVGTNPGGISESVATLGEEVTAKAITVKVVMGASDQAYAPFNMFTEVAVSTEAVEEDDDSFKDTYTHVDGETVGTTQSRGEGWESLLVPDFWYVVEDGETEVTIKVVVDNRVIAADDTMLRVWIDADPSDTARTTLVDTKVADGAAYVARVDGGFDAAILSQTYSVIGNDYYLTVVLDKAALGIDGQYGMLLTLSETGYNSMHNVAWDVEDVAGAAPWNTTKDYILYGVESAEELPEEATVLDYFGYTHTHINYVMYVDADMTLGELVTKYFGQSKDLNYFKVIVVNEDGTVAATYLTLDRPDGVKSDFTVTEGQYVIALSADGSNAGRFEIADTVNVGDIVTLYNVDFTAEPGELTNAGFTVEAASGDLNEVDGGDLPALNPMFGQNVVIPANTALSYTVEFEDGAFFALYDENVTVLVNGEAIDGEANLVKGDVVTLINASAEEYVAYPRCVPVIKGTMSDPIVLEELGDITANLTENNTDGAVHYIYTATADGTLTITMPESGWTYTVNNLTAGVYGDSQWSDSDPVVNPCVLEVAAGDEIMIIVAPFDEASQMNVPGELTFNVAFEESSVTGNVIVPDGWGAVDVLIDGYTGVGEITAHDGNHDKLVPFKNANVDEDTAYSFIVPLAESTSFNTVTVYILSHTGGNVGLPKTLSVTINGKTYEAAAVTGDDASVVAIVVDLGETVEADKITVNATIAAGSVKYNAYSEIEVSTVTAKAPDMFDIKISHNTNFNWNTYEGNLIAALPNGDGKTCEVAGDVTHFGAGTIEAESGLYVVENVDGLYVITEYVTGIEAMKATAIPEGGFLYFVCSGNSDWDTVKGGAILGYIFNLNDIDINSKAAIDTSANPAMVATLVNPEALKVGDVNMNGKIDANDYATIRKLVVGSLNKEDLSAKALELADVNGNGKIDANDYILVKRHVLGTYTIPAWEDVE